MKIHPDDSLKLENQLCHRLYVVSNAIVRSYRPFLKQLNLTYPQYVVMMALWEKDDVVIGDLQQKTLIDSGALTLILKKLYKKELIAVGCTETDKRKKQITLSESGQKLKKTALAIPQRMDGKEIQISNKEKQYLMKTMDELKAQLLAK